MQADSRAIVVDENQFRRSIKLVLKSIWLASGIMLITAVLITRLFATVDSYQLQKHIDLLKCTCDMQKIDEDHAVLDRHWTNGDIIRAMATIQNKKGSQ